MRFKSCKVWRILVKATMQIHQTFLCTIYTSESCSHYELALFLSELFHAQFIHHKVAVRYELTNTIYRESKICCHPQITIQIQDKHK